MPQANFLRALLGKPSVAPVIAWLFLASPLVAADVMRLHLDATDAPRRRLAVHLVIPTKPGPLTLCYPKWIAGEHGPSGPVSDLAGVKIHAGGKAISWKRDEEDMYALSLTVPEGASEIEVEAELLSPASERGSMTPRLAVLYWNQVLLYPKGSVIQETRVAPSLTLPNGWKMACALPIEKTGSNGEIEFKPVTLERLCDSPVLCGQYFKEVALDPPDGRGPKHWLCIAADSEAALELSPELKANYERLVAEGKALFGAEHYDSYRFLLTLSDQAAHFGLEHHESSDNRQAERMLIDPLYRQTYAAVLLPHEFVHSWNGKYRRPAGLVGRDFQEPMRTKLLWVYEGLTEYLGRVLAARSGLWTPEISRESLARIAEWSKNQSGRDWRSLEDTAVAAQHLYRARPDGEARRRGVDFYDEGALIWLDADTLIREKTGGKKSLDDFCKAFFGGKTGPPAVKPYDFEDLVSTLNSVLPYDWKGFFEKRVMQAGAEPPLDGIARGGWKLAYAAKRTKGQESAETDKKELDFTTSIGLLLKDDGTVIDVIPGKSADKAGMAPGMKLTAVNGRKWTADILRTALAGTKDGKGKLELLCENADYFETFPISYSGGEKYATLEQVSGKRDLLGEIFQPKTPVIGAVPKK
jgi:predicted metalloprotease with PDZ domain